MPCILICADAGASTETHHSIHELATTLGSWWAHVARTSLVDTDATVTQVRDAIDEVVEARDHRGDDVALHLRDPRGVAGAVRGVDRVRDPARAAIAARGPRSPR